MAAVKTLSEGVRLYAVQTDRFKTSSIAVTMALPMSTNLSANALLINVLKHSCKKYPDFVMLNSRLSELYGASVGASVIKSGEAQLLTLSTVCIDDRFALGEDEKISAECADLLCGMLFEPDLKNGKFNSDIVAEEKRLLLQRIDEEINDKRYYAGVRCEQILCRDEAYGKSRYGERAEVEAVTPDDIYDAWQNLLRSARIMITCVSSSDGKRVEKIFKKGFSKIEREPAEITTEYRKKAGAFRRVEEKYPVNQGKLVLGFRTGMSDIDDMQYPEILMIDLFGGNVYSKLFLNVREKLSLCYYCWAKLHIRKGVVFVDCGIDTENEKKATSEIVKQLQAIRDGDFTDEDMAASLMGMRERWLSMDEPMKLCLWYGAQVCDDTLVTPEEKVAKLEKVTKDEVCAAAKRLSLEAVYMLSAEIQEGENNED
ncbi:MAG: insulinase family protein [Clostridia bacterium]|nr:insulinase family protein [Clostridia bacterium]